MSNADTPITVRVGSDQEPFTVGVPYRAQFVEYDGPIEGEPTRYSEGRPSIYFRFVWDGDDGRRHVAFVDKPSIGYPKVGDNSNKFGRFLAGLAGKPPTEEFTIVPSEYYGKWYSLIYSTSNNGNVKLQSFTPVA